MLEPIDIDSSAWKHVFHEDSIARTSHFPYTLHNIITSGDETNETFKVACQKTLIRCNSCCNILTPRNISWLYLREHIIYVELKGAGKGNVNFYSIAWSDVSYDIIYIGITFHTRGAKVCIRWIKIRYLW